LAENITWVACIAGIALALGAVAVILYLMNRTTSTNTGVMYTYDEDNRLQSIMPLNQNTQFVRLKKAE